MKRNWLYGAAVCGILSIFGLTSTFAAPGNGNGQPPSWSSSLEKNCAPAVQGEASCHSWTLHTFLNGKEISDAKEFEKSLKQNGLARTNVAPSGYSPTELRNVYGVKSPSGSMPTIAIVDAFNSYVTGNLVSDLNAYRNYYGLGSADIKIYNQSGNQYISSASFSGYKSNRGWDGEIALDVDMVSAICPTCKIALYLSKTANYSDLNSTVNSAALNVSVNAISNSYGGGDVSSSTFRAYSDAAAKNIVVTASTGDNGYGVSAPASFSGVVAVGGTSLTNSSGIYSEKAWSGSGSGCSSIAVNSKLGIQTVSGAICANKVNADISAVADPNTGVSVYLNGLWKVYGGTSASSPIIATYLGIIQSGATLSGVAYWAQKYVWSKNWADVASGSNGACNPIVLCNATNGWDGPTGLGTPRASG
jgi:subtilase family serine protease